MSITAGGAFSWTPTEEQGAGTYPVTITVTDNGGCVMNDFETFSISVTEVNVAPILANVPVTPSIPEEVAYSFTATATDADNTAQTLTFSLSGAPAGAAIDGVTGVFTWTPSEVQGADVYTFDVIVSDGDLTDTEPITITVTEVNVAPILANVPVTPSIPEEVAYSFTATATDADNTAQTLTFSLSGAPAGAAIDGVTGVFTWTPSEAQGADVYTFDVIVSDGDLTDTEPITITVTEVNVAPILANVPVTPSIPEEVAYSFTATATDADNTAQTLTFSLSGAPAGAAIDGVTGVFTWTPSEVQGADVYTFDVIVSDGDLTDTEPITITVTEVNVAPILANVPVTPSIPEEVAYSFTATATDADNTAQTLTFSLSGAPAGAAIDGVTGVFTWTPSEAQGADVYTFDVIVSDGDLTDTEPITITVTEVNVAPILANVPVTPSIPEEVAYSFTATATDADNTAQTLTFSLSGAPAGAAIDGVTGVFTWTPSEVQGADVYTFDVIVSDGDLTDTEPITITVTEVNVAPILANVPVTPSIPEEVAYSFTATATDADNTAQTLTFSLSGAPAGAAIDGVTGVFTWTPSEAQGADVYTFDVIVSDGDLTDTEPITITVTEVNVAPILANVPVTPSIPEEVAYSFTATATDADNTAQTLTFSLSGAPAGAAIDGVTGVFTWTPSEAQGADVYTFDVIVSDGDLTDTEPITITVTEVNVAPILANVPVTPSIPEEVAYSFTATATDADNTAQTLTFSLSGAPAGAAIDGVTGVFTWTPSEAQGADVYTFDVIVSDGDLTDTEPITITVTEVNVAPILANVPVTPSIPEEVAYSFTATATDADNTAQTLTFSLSGAPAGAAIDGVTGVFTWTPSEAQGADVYTFDVIVSDGDLTDTEPITITVTEVNVAPILANVPVTPSIPEEVAYSFTATATDADNTAQTLTFSLSGAPAGAAIDGVTGVFTWTPSEAQGADVYTFDVIVSDGDLTDTEPITITVTEVNVAPILANVPVTPSIPEEVAYSFTATATDADNTAQTLTFSLSGAPAGAAIDGVTGVFTWTPSEAQGADVYTFDVIVSDGDLTDTEPITITVTEVNVAPILANVPVTPSIPEEVAYSFTATATDADNTAQTLTFSLSGAPAGAAIDGVTGVFTWTPSEAQGADVYTFDVIVSDGDLTDTEPITITVTEVNVAPILANVPVTPSIPEEVAYSFTATATDADNTAQTLTFSLSGAPAGAAIDGVTGVFTWTPSEAQGADVYTFDVIVSDGDLTDTEPITITVTEVNVAPILANVPVTPSIPEEVAYSFTATATDADNTAQTLTFSLSGAPAGAAIDGVTGVFTWTPSEAQGADVYTFDVIVSDGDLTDTEPITITVTEVNVAPILANVPVTPSIPEEVAYSFTATATDADNTAQTLTFSLSGAPAGAAIDGVTGVFTWTPSEAQGADVYTFDVIVSDGDLTDTEPITITVTEVNVAPILANVPVTPSIPEEVAYSFTATATDADNTAQTLTFSLSGAPAGAAIDGVTGVFTWTPSEAQGADVYTFDVIVSDGDLTDTEPITITVTEVNVAPILANVPVTPSIPEEVAYSFTATATDADNTAQTLTFSLSGAPAGAAIDGVTGVFTWTPSEAQGADVYTFDVIVSDGDLTDTEPITITVTEVNVAPILANVPVTPSIPEEVAYSFTATATDADNTAQTLTFSLSGAPAGAAIDGVTGVFTWTPSEAQGADVYTFDVIVSDGDLTDTEPITITVTEVNVAPILANVPVTPSIPEEVAYSFTATATDADNTAQTLTFSLSGAPAGAAIDGVTGVFTWTPSEAQGADVYTFDVIVSDGDLTDTEPITITVTEVNVAPILANVPVTPSIPEEVAYSFTATATDADNTAQTLTFSLSGAPAGAAIDGVTGVFTWTPSEAQGADVYTFDVIVSDGDLTDTEPITITVTEVNVAPILESIGPKTVNILDALTFTALATDADLNPANVLTYSLVNAPVDATINPSSGAFSWIPPLESCSGTYTLTVKVTDNGTPQLSDEEEITVTVIDKIAPNAICQDITVELSAAVNAGAVSITPEQIDNGSTDNCGIASISVLPNLFTCANVGANTVTLTVIDVNGNESSCTAIVTVLDDIAPIFACPDDQTLTLEANGCFANYTPDAITATDNCGTIIPVTGTRDDGLNLNDPYPAGGHVQITWTSQDASLNQKSCIQDIFVEGTPVISVDWPDDVYFDTDLGQCQTAFSHVNYGNPVNGGTCGTVNFNNIEFDFERLTMNGDPLFGPVPYPKGQSIVRWSASRNVAPYEPLGQYDQIVTIEDNEDPVIAGTISVTTVEGCVAGDATQAVSTVADLEGLGLTISDNCSSDLDLVVTHNDVSASTCPIVVTRTYTVTDLDGNSNTYDQIINVDDNTAPTFTRPADIEIFTAANCSYDITVANVGDVTDEADNCSTGIDATFVDGTPAPIAGCEGGYTIARTWSLVDNCGNAAATQVQTITVRDNTAPTFTRPADIEIFTAANCSYDITVANVGDVTDEADNCSTGIDATFVDGTPAPIAGCEGGYTIARTWSLVDNCGNAAATQVQTITIRDNTAPTFTRPADIEIFTAANCSYDITVANVGDVTDEADNCSTGIDATFVDGTPAPIAGCEGGYTIARTWSLVDNCGNAAATQVQTITIRDNTAPTFTRPADIEIFTAANCSYDITVANVGDVTDEADNCSTGIDATFVDGTPAPIAGCEGGYTIARTWSLVDNCGNAAATQVQTITIRDNTAPTFTRPADIEIFTAANCSYDITVANVGDVTDEADNCSTGIDATFVDGTPAPIAGCEGGYTIARTWSLVDNCGNAAATQVQTITIRDNTAPTFTRPADIEIFTAANCSYDITVANVGDVTDEADNCSTGIDATFVDGTPAPIAGCEGGYTIARTWSLVDNCGNAAATQVQTITIRDNTAPTFTRPADIEIFTAANCSYDITVANVGDVTDEADNCSTGIDATFVDGTPAPIAGCEGGYTIARTWSLVDNCGNAAATQVQTITIRDNTAPTFTRPADIEIFTAANCSYDITVANVGDVTDEADNCSTGIDATFVDGTPAPIAGCEGGYTIARTWSLVDNCGNAAATQVQTITIRDNTAPTFTRPADIEIFTAANCSYDITVANVGDVTDEADNCSTGIDATFVDGTPAPIAGCEGGYTIARTWSLVDNCGNAAATQVQTITVRDNTAPTFTRPADIEIFTAANCSYDITVANVGDVTDEADNCSTGIDATFVDGTPAPIAGCEGGYTIARTWSLVDNCGNAAATQVQTITIRDNTAPTFTRPADIEIFTAANCSYDITVANVGDVTDEADNCSTGIDATFVDGTPAPIAGCEGGYTIARTWSLVDNCGNAAATQVQTITVRDNTAPTFTRPADIEIFTAANCSYDITVANVGDVTDEADNCSTGIDATFVDGTPAPIAGCEGGYTIARTWSLVDNCGNAAATQVQTITIRDNTAPTFTRPADIEIFTAANCSYDITVANVGDVTDEADNCSTGIDATFVDGTPAPIAGCEGGYTIARTWSLVDNCGNAAATQVQTITIRDNTAPTFTRPADIEIFTAANCSYDITVANVGDVTDEADNCSTGIDATFVDGTPAPIAGCEGGYTIARTWSLVDNCGNAAATQVQTITIRDNTAPTFTRPADIEIFTAANCSYDITVANVGDVTDEADNCSTGIDATFVDGTPAPIAGCEGGYTIARTWSLVDNCGNAAATQVQTITIRDNTAPTFTRPADIEIFTAANCSYDITVANVGDVTDEADNCSTGIDATFVDGTPAPIAGCEGGYTIARTWSLVDNCGNAAATQVQTITIRDNTAPTFTRPADIEIFTAANCSYDITVANVGDVTDEADNCSTGIDATFVDGTPAPIAGCEGGYTIARTWSLVDNCGNAAATQVQTITIRDNTAPTFTRPADIEIFTAANCSYDITVANVGDVTDEADNCSTGIDATFVDGTPAPIAGCEGGYTIARTWSLVDNCGNAAATQVQTITIRDNTAPTFTRPADIEIFTAANCSYDITVANVGDVTDEADNCSTGIDATFVDGTPAPIAGCEGGYTIARTWSLVDNCGNAAATQVQTITIRDNTAPTFTRPADIEIFTAANCSYDITVANVGDVTDEADNCSTGIDATFVDGTPAPIAGCEGGYTIARTWSLVDNCGNAAATQVQTITIRDNTAPVIVNLTDQTRSTNAGVCNYTATGNEFNVTATDNCSNVTYSYTLSGETSGTGSDLNGVIFNKGVTTVSWTATDACGNTSEPSLFTVTVIDNEKPVITCPANLTAIAVAPDCSANVTLIPPTATDNCGILTIYPTRDDTDVLGNPLPITDPYPIGITTITWTAYDVNNNFSTCQQTVRVDGDQTPPEVIWPGNIILNADGNCQAFINPTELVLPIIGDHCGNVDIRSNRVGGGNIADPWPLGTGSIRWRIISDIYGTLAQYYQQVTVNDITPPVVTTVAGNLDRNLECSDAAGIAAALALAPEATDNCTANPVIHVVSDVTTPDPACTNAYIQVRTWNFTDDSSNPSENFVQTITVIDNTVPAWTTLAAALNTSVECSDAAALVLAQAMAPVATDNCGSVTYEKTSGDFVAGACGATGTYTNTWIAKDECNNPSTMFTQVITITDETVPAWTTLAAALNTSVECSDAAALVLAQAMEPVATDNCGSVTYEKTSGDFVAGACGATGTYTNTWIAKDECNNPSTMFTQVITITDETVPAWTTLAAELNTSVECSDAAALVLAQAMAPVATDNCGLVTYEKTSGDFVAGACGATGTYTNTWIAKDECNNPSTMFTQVITITDETVPAWTTLAAELNTSVECSDAAALVLAQAMTPVATDNCGSVTYEKTSGDFVAGACGATGTYTNTWIAKDECNNPSTMFTQVITITDETVPAWTTLAAALNTSVECSDAAALVLAQAMAPVATDNCGSVTYEKTSGDFVAGACGATGTYTNTWIAKDECNNPSTMFTQVITITDETVPAWTTLAAELNTSVECSDAAALVLAQAMTPVATDNCGSVTYEKTSGDFVAGACGATGTYTNTWIAKDECNNPSTMFTQVITITDETVPAWTTLAAELNTSVECSDAAALVLAQAMTPVATDNCGSVTYEKTSGDFVAGACGATGTYTNTWIAKDECNNPSTMFTQVITITDETVPAWTTLAAELNTSVECSDAAALVLAQAMAPVATDNCGLVTYEKTSGDFVAGACGATGTYTNTWIAKDECNNPSTMFTQVITITDETVPAWTTLAAAAEHFC